MKFCDLCGEPLYDGMMDPWGSGDRYLHEECFEEYMNRTYGKGRWRSVDDDGEGGFYEAKDDNGNWYGTGAFYSTWPDDEEDIIERLRDAEAALPEGYELEVYHFTCNEKEKDGWYAMQYSEVYGGAEPIGGVNDFIIALDDELFCEGIDIYKILDGYGCFYC